MPVGRRVEVHLETAESARLDQAHRLPLEAPADLESVEEDEPPRGPRKGNPRRLSKKNRATQRALGRLRSGHPPNPL